MNFQEVENSQEVLRAGLSEIIQTESGWIALHQTRAKTDSTQRIKGCSDEQKASNTKYTIMKIAPKS